MIASYAAWFGSSSFGFLASGVVKGVASIGMLSLFADRSPKNNFRADVHSSVFAPRLGWRRLGWGIFACILTSFRFDVGGISCFSHILFATNLTSQLGSFRWRKRLGWRVWWFLAALVASLLSTLDFLVWFSHFITLQTMQQTQHQITFIQKQDQITIPQTKQGPPENDTARSLFFLENRK